MKNVANVETVDKTRHANLRVKTNPDLVHAKDNNLAAVMLAELGATACNFPIVFIQSPDSGQLRPAAMFGLRPGENVFYGAEGWDCTYVPVMIQRHPFVIGFDDRSEDPNQLATCLIRTSPFVSETDGIALFTETGEETDYLKSRHMLMRDIFEGERFLEEFMQKLKQLDLLTDLELQLQLSNGEGRRVTGMQTVNQAKMRELTPEQVADLNKNDFLAACHLIMASVFQIHRLMQFRTRKQIEAVTNYSIVIDPKSQQQAA